ncbi:39S ribosomal protein L9, mitochondrial-like [Anneissia japonica]|uniref:39S ribosomal protein L9, mitochondrial-like n=1 Tax=Anneissia japonica TaxID=1529436 RepID=UPI0014259B33|nr:39S ribosomal protein L9, mitochondrial-like [Anneissia japonica]
MSWNFGTKVGCQLLQSFWKSAVIKEQIRNTVIVRRVTPAGLPKFGEEYPRKMKKRHKVFYVEENLNLKPQGHLQLILLQDVPKIGLKGEIVTVTKRVGRNKLLMNQLATYATPENIEELAAVREEQGEDAKLTPSARRTIEYLKQKTLTVEMRPELDWTLCREEVLHAFKKNLGVMVADHALTMPTKEITNEYGMYEVKVTINGIATVPVAMEVIKAIDKSRRAKKARKLAEEEAARLAELEKQQKT